MNRCLFVRNIAIAAVGFAAIRAISNTPLIAAEPADKALQEKLLLKEEPKDAADVLAVRQDAKDQQDVVVVGRIGGRANPWVKGSTVFSIVDRSLKPCNEIPGDACETPWDYCCEADLPKATLLVMVMDEQGKLLKKDARELLGVKELDTVVVRGKAKRDKAGNLTILASSLFVATDDKQRPQGSE